MTQQTAAPNAGNTDATANATAQSETPESWDAWLATQPEAQRTTIASLYEKQTSGLKSALDKEREDKKSFKTQLDGALKAAEKGSEAEKQLMAISEQLEASNRRADFYEVAAKPEIGLVDTKAAWVLMNADPERYFDRKGNPNFDLLKQEHAGLFGTVKPVPKGNQGNGTNSSVAGTSSFNDEIRRAAGYTR